MKQTNMHEAIVLIIHCTFDVCSCFLLKPTAECTISYLATYVSDNFCSFIYFKLLFERTSFVYIYYSFESLCQPKQLMLLSHKKLPLCVLSWHIQIVHTLKDSSVNYEIEESLLCWSKGGVFLHHFYLSFQNVSTLADLSSISYKS